MLPLDAAKREEMSSRSSMEMRTPSFMRPRPISSGVRNSSRFLSKRDQMWETMSTRVTGPAESMSKSDLGSSLMREPKTLSSPEDSMTLEKLVPRYFFHANTGTTMTVMLSEVPRISAASTSSYAACSALRAALTTSQASWQVITPNSPSEPRMA